MMGAYSPPVGAASATPPNSAAGCQQHCCVSTASAPMSSLCRGLAWADFFVRRLAEPVTRPLAGLPVAYVPTVLACPPVGLLAAACRRGRRRGLPDALRRPRLFGVRFRAANILSRGAADCPPRLGAERWSSALILPHTGRRRSARSALDTQRSALIGRTFRRPRERFGRGTNGRTNFALAISCGQPAPPAASARSLSRTKPAVHARNQSGDGVSTWGQRCRVRLRLGATKSARPVSATGSWTWCALAGSTRNAAAVPWPPNRRSWRRLEPGCRVSSHHQLLDDADQSIAVALNSYCATLIFGTASHA